MSNNVYLCSFRPWMEIEKVFRDENSALKYVRENYRDHTAYLVFSEIEYQIGERLEHLLPNRILRSNGMRNQNKRWEVEVVCHTSDTPAP